MFSYESIIQSLPTSFQDYIESGDEWVRMVNQAVRRAVMQTRRFVRINTDAPFPLDVASCPIATRAEGLETYNEIHYIDAQGGFLSNKLFRWSNGLSYPKSEYVINVTDNKLYINFIGGSQGISEYEHRDVCVVCYFDKALFPNKYAEYFIGKYKERLQDTLVYDLEFPYMRKTDVEYASIIRYDVAFPSVNNIRYDYYFIPQHSASALFSRELEDADGSVSVGEEYLLAELFVGDEILANLIRLELKKAYYEFIEDTSDPSGLSRVEEQIAREVERTRIVANTPLVKSIINNGSNKPRDILFSAR